MMIIKSLSRTSKSFAQLITYFERPGSRPELQLTHNLYSDPEDRAGIIEELETNSEYLPPRKKGTFLRHDILSLAGNSTLLRREHIEALLAIGKRYLELRAPHQLAFGELHEDTDHCHLHLCISSNEPRSDRRVRLTKAQFRTVQIETERYQAQEFPELNEPCLYDPARSREKRGPRIGNDDFEVAKREGRAPLKKVLYELLLPELSSARSLEDLTASLSQVGYSLYKRGGTYGIECEETGRRHRLHTLGLAHEFDQAFERFSHSLERSKELKQNQDSVQQEVTRELSFDVSGGISG